MKFIAGVFLLLYLYTLAFGIFMTEIFRIPAPFLFGVPLLLFFRQQEAKAFLYGREAIVITVAAFIYDVIGLSDFKGFAAHILTIAICLLVFNYFIGKSRIRFNVSVLIFMLLLLFSSVIMVLNHYYGAMDNLRAVLLDDIVLQSPAGIATTQFNFGYQLAVLAPFVFIYTCISNQATMIKAFALAVCLVLLFLGMQRSVFVCFICSAIVFLVLYYRFKAVLVIALVTLTCFLLYNYVLKDNLDTVNNIVTKNEHNDAAYDRYGLAEQNFNIYLDYPFGLIFYGKDWSDVIYRDYVFSSGITSHNAYLMFFTYLGPFLGLGLLWAIYDRVVTISLNTVSFIRKKENAMMVCLCFAFLSVSINALSHNPWLLAADGPTVFLYFSILHLYKISIPTDDYA